MSKPVEPLGRRHLLGGAAAAGVAVAAVAVLAPSSNGEVGSASSEVQPSPPGQAQGYRLTEHIQQYYRTARI